MKTRRVPPSGQSQVVDRDNRIDCLSLASDCSSADSLLHARYPYLKLESLSQRKQKELKPYRVEMCDISLVFAIRNYEFMHMQGYTTRHRVEAYITRDVLQAIVWSLISFYILKPNNIVNRLFKEFLFSSACVSCLPSILYSFNLKRKKTIKDIFIIPVVTIASVHIFERIFCLFGILCFTRYDADYRLQYRSFSAHNTCDAKAMQTRKTNETQALAWEENVPTDDPRKFGLITGIGGYVIENNAIALCRSNGLESMEGRVTLAKSIESFNHEAFRQHNSLLINPIAADNSTLILL
uniref:Uncharacterized protein n=1 Tax=Glossina palpalis gambiensis TaxID=67801 RepID=A0A1B0B0H2_9MUSC